MELVVNFTVPARVYVDSSVLCNWYSEDNNASPKNSFKPNIASKFLDDVKEGKYEAVVSLLAIKEVVKFIRNIFVLSGKSKSEAWMKEEKNVIDRILRLQGVKIIEGRADEIRLLKPEEMAFGNLSHDALAILQKYGGGVKFIKKKERFEHDGVHPMDVLHIALAKKMLCAKIATFDKDFKETKKEIESIILEYPRKKKKL